MRLVGVADARAVVNDTDALSGSPEKVDGEFNWSVQRQNHEVLHRPVELTTINNSQNYFCIDDSQSS